MRSASCSKASPGTPIASFGWTGASPRQRGHPPPHEHDAAFWTYSVRSVGFSAGKERRSFAVRRTAGPGVLAKLSILMPPSDDRSRIEVRPRRRPKLLSAHHAGNRAHVALGLPPTTPSSTYLTPDTAFRPSPLLKNSDEPPVPIFSDVRGPLML